jgi:hypothetical protein
MRPLSRTKAQIRLRKLKDEFRKQIFVNYEHRAKSCDVCDTKGACCLDAHFVNVRVSKLEAEAISRVINELPAIKKAGVLARSAQAIGDLDLSTGEANSAATYACPLFDRDAGCLVHETAKPLPCINHACYERKEDLPPETLLAQHELNVEDLNIRTYGRATPWLPIPVAIQRLGE